MSRLIANGLLLPAGTATVPPMSLQSGTNLSTPAAGAVEYDGRAVYATTSTSHGRALVRATNFYRLNADLAGVNGTAVQKVLGVGLSVAASTIYEFEYLFVLSKTAGTASHSIALNFGGTATFNNAIHSALETSTATANLAASLLFVTSMSSNISYSMGTTATNALTAVGRGTVSVNAGGTLIPQYTLSAGPGAAYSTLAGSYFAIWPVGAAGSATSVGVWA